MPIDPEDIAGMIDSEPEDVGGGAQVIYATLEPSIHNTDGTAATLYFSSEPTEEEINAAFQEFSAYFKQFHGSLPNLGPEIELGAWPANNAMGIRYQCSAG